MRSKRPRLSSSGNSSTVAADELRQFVERYEQLEAEKKDVAENQKELMAEAKALGAPYELVRLVEIGRAHV